MKTIIGLLISALLVSSVFAQSPSAPVSSPTKAAKKLPPTGTLASYLVSAATSAAMPIPCGGVDYTGGGDSPLLGSITRRDENTYLIRVTNQSKDQTIEVNLQFVLYNAKGAQLKTDPFSLILRPGEKNERPASGISGAAMGLLNITSWKERQ